MMPNMVKKFTDRQVEQHIGSYEARRRARIEQELRDEQCRLQRIEDKAKINEKANELLKKWLSPAEYNYLQENKEVEFPSQYEKDVIYIVKKDAKRKVVKKVNGVATHELCILPLEYQFTNDDGLLSKILMLKTNEKEFIEITTHYPLGEQE